MEAPLLIAVVDGPHLVEKYVPAPPEICGMFNAGRTPTPTADKL